LFDPKSIASDTAVNTRAGLGLGKDEFVLLYLGSLGTWYMLDEMLKFFKELKAEKSKRQISCKFLFLTRDKQIISDLAVQNDLSAKDIIITHSDRINVPTYISICDAGIFFILPTFSKKASAATKMGEIMAMGKPVITNTEWGDVDAILENSGNGVVVKSLNVAGYRQAINSMDMIQFDPESIRQSGEQHFSLDKGIQAYHEIYLQQKGNWV
jgi:glycosyltransferase involved in cell wall biosynthesis